MIDFGKSKNIINKKCKLILKRCSSFIIFILSYSLYFFSLEPCVIGDDICGNNMKWIYKKLTQLVISSEIISLLVIKILFYDLSKLHLIHILIIFSIFYKYSNDFFFYNHGMYNLIVFLSILFLNIFAILFFKLIRCLILHINKIYIFFKLSYIILLLIIYYYQFPNINCEEWKSGLNNTYIDNDEKKYGCKIRIPQYCLYKIISPFQDFSKILNIDCSHKKSNARKTILKVSKSPYITKKTKIFGFPPTNVDPIGLKDGIDTKILNQYVMDNLFDIKNNFNNFSEPEIIVDFSRDSSGELLVNLKYNESLSLERKDLENKTHPYSQNILIIYLDSVSRPQSIRKLKKTLNFFEKFISFQGGFNEKYPEEKFHSFQFFKYHSFLGRTAENFPRLFYGSKRNSTNITRINKYFKENGFVSSYCCDVCQKDNTRTHHDITISELYDHQFLFCDPNVHRYHRPIKKCLYGKVDSDYLFNYTEQFWRKYQNNRKFSTIIINSAHEGTMEVIKYLDEIIFNHLNSLFNDNLLKDSSIFLLSDHGMGIQSIYYIMDFFKIEYQLPMLYTIINDRKNISYNDQYYYMNQNQQTFITAYDFYNTVNNLLYGDDYINILNQTNEKPTPKSSLGISLFEKIDQKVRKAKNYENMEQNICV